MLFAVRASTSNVVHCADNNSCAGIRSSLPGQLKSNIERQLGDSTSYGSNGPVACQREICAVLKGTQPGKITTGSDIKHYMSLLTQEGCKSCGSVSMALAGGSGGQFLIEVYQLSKTGLNPAFTVLPALPGVSVDVKT